MHARLEHTIPARYGYDRWPHEAIFDRHARSTLRATVTADAFTFSDASAYDCRPAIRPCMPILRQRNC